MRPDLSKLASGFSADATKILFDQPGAAYDQVYTLLEKVAPLPATRRGRTLFVGIVLFVKHVLFGKPAATGPMGHFVSDVADDGMTETLKRVIQHAGLAHTNTPRRTGPVIDIPTGPTREPLSRRIDVFTNTIAPWMGQKEK